MSHADVEGIAAATANGGRLGAHSNCASNYRDNHVWIVHCDTGWIAPECARAPFDAVPASCMKQARYLVLVSDETGKVINSTP
jgi:hypothetical protein